MNVNPKKCKPCKPRPYPGILQKKDKETLSLHGVSGAGQ